MITKELIQRINELAKKKRTEGLTPEDAAEQQRLRQQYLAGIRAQLKVQLDSIEFVDPDDPRLKTQKHHHIVPADYHREHSHSCTCGGNCGGHDHSGDDEGHGCGCQGHSGGSCGCH